MDLFYDVGVMKSLLCIIFFVLLTIVSISDLYKMKIPNQLCIAIFVLGIISIFFIKEISIWDRFLGAVAISVPMIVIAMITKRSFGGGDIKLMAAAGVFLGAELIIVGAVLGLLMTGSYIIISFITKNRGIKSGLALGPCFSIGMIISCMLGGQIWKLIF